MFAPLRDGLEWSRKATPRRLRNAAALWSSFQRAKSTRDPRIGGLPFSISFEPTTACNLRCPECPSGLRSFTRPTGNFKEDLFPACHGRAATTSGLYLIFYFQGEPYINPKFLDMVAHARSRGLYTITSTNGHFLNDENARRTIESGLDRLIISVDGTTRIPTRATAARANWPRWF